jgi:threonine aldolase
MDGARIANAAASLGTGFREITADAGVDVLSFGGTKNGLMFGETVIFFGKEKGKDFQYLRKQGMQLHSKMRYIAAQFNRYLTGDLWKKNALQANRMAKKLVEALKRFPQLKITQEVKANGVFCIMPPGLIPLMQEAYFFHIWNPSTHEVRLMCSWDTTEEDIDTFAGLLEQNIKNL